LDVLNEAEICPFKPSSKGLQSHVLIDNDGQVANNRRKF
jgi:hypothetical protein